MRMWMWMRPIVNGPHDAGHQTQKNEYLGNIQRTHTYSPDGNYTLVHKQRESRVMPYVEAPKFWPIGPASARQAGMTVRQHQSSSSPAVAAWRAGSAWRSPATQT